MAIDCPLSWHRRPTTYRDDTEPDASTPPQDPTENENVPGDIPINDSTRVVSVLETDDAPECAQHLVTSQGFLRELPGEDIQTLTSDQEEEGNKTPPLYTDDLTPLVGNPRKKRPRKDPDQPEGKSAPTTPS